MNAPPIRAQCRVRLSRRKIPPMPPPAAPPAPLTTLDALTLLHLWKQARFASEHDRAELALQALRRYLSRPSISAWDWHEGDRRDTLM